MHAVRAQRTRKKQVGAHTRGQTAAHNRNDANPHHTAARYRVREGIRKKNVCEEWLRR